MKMMLLDGHERYIDRTYHFPRNGIRIWMDPLDQFVDGHVDYDVAFGEFEAKQRKLLIELIRRVSMIPPRGNRSAGLAMVNLCCHLAWACRISDAAAFRIVCDVYEWQSQGGIKRKPPVSSLNSFRVLKNRLMELRPAA
jgi:hypothetical protein